MAPIGRLPRSRSGVRMLIVAHRGSMALEPENSIAAFRRAVNDGADLLETDLRLSSEGEFVCFHDETLERTTGAAGRASGKRLPELKTLSLRWKGNIRSEEKIPALDDVVAILPAEVSLALELKDPRFAETAVCAQLVGKLRDLRVIERTMVLAASRKKVRAMREANPCVPVGYISFALGPADSVELLGPIWPLLSGIIHPQHGAVEKVQNRQINRLVSWGQDQEGLEKGPFNPEGSHDGVRVRYFVILLSGRSLPLTP